MQEFINNMRMEQDNEILECDKIEYNGLLERVKKYHELSKELQKKHDRDFTKLIIKMDKLICEMGVDNATTDEWQNGFKLKGEK